MFLLLWSLSILDFHYLWRRDVFMSNKENIRMFQDKFEFIRMKGETKGPRREIK